MDFKNVFLLQRSRRSTPEEPGARVVACDPDPQDLRHLSDLLEELNFAVLPAEDSQTALKLVRRHRPVLVISSLEPPAAEGYGLFQKIRQDPELAHIPLMFVTPPGKTPDQILGHQSYASDYIQKPISMSEFTSRIRSILKRSSGDASGQEGTKAAPAPPSPGAGAEEGGSPKEQIERYLQEFRRNQEKAGPAGPKAREEPSRPQEEAEEESAAVPLSEDRRIEELLSRMAEAEDWKGKAPEEDQPAPEPAKPAPKKTAAQPLRGFRFQEFLEREGSFETPADTYREARLYVLDSIRRAGAGELPDVSTGMATAAKLVDGVADSPELLRVALDRTQKFSLASHSVNTSVVALKVSAALGYDLERQLRVGLAALLHEVGIVNLPVELLYRPGQLQPQELQILRSRPLEAVRILSRLGSQYDWLSEITGQVFERETGSGFPRGLTGEKMPDEAKLLAAADTFDACIHERPHRPALTGYQTLFEMAIQDTGYAESIVKAFIRSFSLYPYQERVVLSSGEVGLVEEINPGHLARPVVKVLLEADGTAPSENRLLDLSSLPGVHILKAIPVGEFPSPKEAADS